MKIKNILKKIIPFVLTLLLLIAAIPLMVSAAELPTITPLYAGKNTEIGLVAISDDGINMTIRFEIDKDGWFMTKTHVYVGTKAPTKSSPGQFPYIHSISYATSDEFIIPIKDGVKYYVAAHADVVNHVGNSYPTISEITALLPANGNIYAGFPGANSYFDLTVTNSGILNGFLPAWCLDVSHGVSPNITYTANFHSCLAPIPEYLTTGGDPNIDFPGNLDLVNWVINHNSGFSLWEVQNVIWCLIDSIGNIANLSEHELGLYNAACANGEGFVPNFCDGEVIGIIVAPIDATGILSQVIILEFRPTCTPIYKNQTAWGLGSYFWKTSWGSYLSYTP